MRALPFFLSIFVWLTRVDLFCSLRAGFSVERLVLFAERDFERSNRMLVPPEPHVATPHDQTFLITIGTVGAGAAVLYVVDLMLAKYYAMQKKKAKAAKRKAEAEASGKKEE